MKEVADVPYTRSAPIIVAERLSDGIAMMLLALAGVLAFNLGTEIVIVGAVAIGAVIAAIQIRPLALRLLGLAERMPLITSRTHDLRALYDSSYELFRPKALAVAVGIGLVSWGLECVALYLVYVGLGVPATPELLLQSTFILASATLAGSLLLMPGGLGGRRGQHRRPRPVSSRRVPRGRLGGGAFDSPLHALVWRTGRRSLSAGVPAPAFDWATPGRGERRRIEQRADAGSLEDA